MAASGAISVGVLCGVAMEAMLDSAWGSHSGHRMSPGQRSPEAGLEEQVVRAHRVSGADVDAGIQAFNRWLRVPPWAPARTRGLPSPNSHRTARSS